MTFESPGSDKIVLFRSLFRGGEGAYAHGYFNKRKGKIGYSPTCANEQIGRCPRWNGSRRGVVKCGECAHCEFVPLTDDVLRSHFKGGDPDLRDVCGMYVKAEVVVYDYVGASVPMLERMYKRGLRAYARLG